MSILSLVAVSRLAERHVRQHGPHSAKALLDQLRALDIQRDRAGAGVRLAEVTGRLEPFTGDDGATSYRVLEPEERAA